MCGMWHSCDNAHPYMLENPLIRDNETRWGSSNVRRLSSASPHAKSWTMQFFISQIMPTVPNWEYSSPLTITGKCPAALHVLHGTQWTHFTLHTPVSILC